MMLSTDFLIHASEGDKDSLFLPPSVDLSDNEDRSKLLEDRYELVIAVKLPSERVGGVV